MPPGLHAKRCVSDRSTSQPAAAAPGQRRTSMSLADRSSPVRSPAPTCCVAGRLPPPPPLPAECVARVDHSFFRRHRRSLSRRLVGADRFPAHLCASPSELRWSRWNAVVLLRERGVREAGAAAGKFFFSFLSVVGIADYFFVFSLCKGLTNIPGGGVSISKCQDTSRG